jgi:hypothetical protein
VSEQEVGFSRWGAIWTNRLPPGSPRRPAKPHGDVEQRVFRTVPQGDPRRVAFLLTHLGLPGKLILGSVAMLLAMPIAAVTASIGATAASAVTPAGALDPAAGQYFPITPVKVLDTRDGTGGVSIAQLTSGETVDYPVDGVGSIPVSDVSAVFAQVNAISPTASGCLVDYSTDISDPLICNTSFQSGENATVSDIVQVGAGGTLALTNQSTGSVDAAVTIFGYFSTSDYTTAGDTYVGVPETVLVDTRSGIGAPEAQIASNSSLTIQVTGESGVPSDAVGASLFIGAANASTTGYLTAYPTGGTNTGYSVLSYVASTTVRDLYFGALSSSGELTVENKGSEPVDFVIDLEGYLLGPTSVEAGEAYVPLMPTVLSTSNLAANSSVTIQATGNAGLPSSGVAEVVQSVEAKNPTATGWLTVYATGGTASGPVVNFSADDSEDNDLDTGIVSTVSPDGEETVKNNSSGSVSITVSVRGYYASAAVPDAPNNVDGALLQDGSDTATLSWQAPFSDGGAAITSYVASVYNSGGSLNQAITTDGNTFTATATSLNPSDSYTVGVVAENAIGESSSTTADIQALNSGDSVGTLNFESDEVEINLDADTGSETILSANDENGQINSSNEIVGTPTTFSPDDSDVWDGHDGSVSHGCSSGTPHGVTVHTGAVVHNGAEGTSHDMDWYNQLFWVDDARQVTGSSGSYWTMQVQDCASGEGSTSNGYNQYFVGDATMYEAPSDVNYRIHDNYGQGTTSGSAGITLGFTLQLGNSASISASTTIESGAGTYTADFGGSDSRFPGIMIPTAWNYDRMNPNWGSPDNHIWDGTSSTVGNTGSQLFEYPMGFQDNNHHYYFYASQLGFCSNLFGCGSAW